VSGVLADHPDDPDGLFLLGMICMRTDRVPAAAEHFARATRLRTEFAEAHGNLGAALTELGRFDEAVTSFQSALTLKPDQPDTHSNLGAALARMGRLDEAAGAFREAVRLRPKFAEAITNLGAALAKVGQIDEAIAQYRQALELKPNHPETHNNIGSLLLRMHRPPDAEDFLRKATALQPRYAEAHNNLGLALMRQHKVDEAAGCFDRALRLRPEYTDARRNLGVAQPRQGDWQSAADSLRRALEQDPISITSLIWLGKALAELNQLNEAEACYRRALELEQVSDADPFTDLSVADVNEGSTPPGPGARANQVAGALLDLAHMLSLREKPDEALRELGKARSLNPNDAFTINKMGAVLWSLRRYDEALGCFDEAVRIKPDYPDAHLNRSHYFLIHGDFETGLAEYEWRLKIKGYFPDPIPDPHWNGEPLAGRPIMLHHEQGLGDMLMVLRFVPLVKERGGHVIYKCQPPLRGLLAGFPGIDELVSPDAPAPPDAVHAALMSLPRIFNARPTKMPGTVPYLAADPVLVQYWHHELSRISGIRVGIVWQGSPRYASERDRPIAWIAFVGREAVRINQLKSWMFPTAPGIILPNSNRKND